MRFLFVVLLVVGCSSSAASDSVKLLTGGDVNCSIGGVVPMSIVGELVADPEAGTALKADPGAWGWAHVAGATLPVMWSPGFTARRNAGGEVEVLREGQVVVTTGTRVGLSTQFGVSTVNGAFPACDGRELAP